MNDEEKQAAIYEHAKQVSLSILDSGEEVSPVVLFIKGENIGGVEVPTNIKPQHQWRAVMRGFLGAMNKWADAFCFVTETWTSKVANDEHWQEHAPPSEDPKRGEALLVTLYANGKQLSTAMMAFTRKDGKVTHDGKWIETGPGSGFEVGPGSILPNT